MAAANPVPPPFLRRIVTPRVTAHLPDALIATPETDAAAWFDRLTSRGHVLQVSRGTDPIGLLTQHPTDEGLMFGYLFLEEVWGRGYATELVCGLVAAAREAEDLATLLAGVDPANPASAAVLRKAGFARAGTLPGGADLFALVL